jgi:hypothetical protein
LDEKLAREYSAENVMQISVKGYPSVWLIEYEARQADDDLFRRFHLNGSFPIDTYPTPFTLNNIVYVVRGEGNGILSAVLTALWDIAPPTEIVPFGIFLTEYRWRALDASSRAAQWLAERPDAAGLALTALEPLLTTLQRFADVYGFDSLVSNLPHPTSPVWVSEFAGPENEEYLTVVSEFMSGEPVAEVRTSAPLDLSVIAPITPPQISDTAAMDGANGEYDELHTVVQWRGGRGLLAGSENWPEITESYVVERSTNGEENWKPIAWLRRDAWDMTKERPTRFMPPAGRAEADYSGDGMPLLSYWDYDVELGVNYDYRIYGCTNLGRQTPYSEVVSAIAGDPDPSTPDPGAHVSSVVVPDCSRGDD